MVIPYDRKVLILFFGQNYYETRVFHFLSLITPEYMPKLQSVSFTDTKHKKQDFKHL